VLCRKSYPDNTLCIANAICQRFKNSKPASQNPESACIACVHRPVVANVRHRALGRIFSARKSCFAQVNDFADFSSVPSSRPPDETTAMALARNALIATLALATLGCRSTPRLQAPPLVHSVTPTGRSPAPPASLVPVTSISYQESLPLAPAAAAAIETQFVGDVLSRQWLIAEIEARNPSLEAMIAAWQAAAQIYPQRVALDDPVLMGMIAPESGASSFTETAYALQLNQKLPWFGKRWLRGDIAAADSEAAFEEAEDSRLQVRLAAELAFYEYFLVARLIEINGQNTRLMEEFREAAQIKYRTNQVTQQDVLQAELELADLARRQLELDRMQRVAAARINTLLRRWPDAPLPPAPTSVQPSAMPADANLLWQTALSQRPDLAALARRIDAAAAELELAYKNYKPDADVFARYDTFWQPSSTQGPLRAQIGLAINLPVYRDKLRAAVCEAQFRLNQRRAEFDQRSLEIQYEVIAAAEQFDESRKAVELYRQRLIPAAEQNIAAARSNYEVGKLNFLELAQAQRQLITLRERQLEAIVTHHRRAAELERAVGGTMIQTP
jgi:outer membrane protein, heavy metal efflux system